MSSSIITRKEVLLESSKRIGKRMAGNPPVDFFQKILVEWMLRVLHHVLEGFDIRM